MNAKPRSIGIVGAGFTGTMLAVHLIELSRRGLLPKPHHYVQPYAPFLRAGDLPAKVSQLFHAVRREIKAATERGIDWRGVIDSLRPQTQALWRNLPGAERRRFLRHIRPYWEVHRHRMSPLIAAEIDELRESGLLSILAGRIVGLAADGKGLRLSVRPRNDTVVQTLSAGWLINCSGPQIDYGRVRDPLVKSLFDSGLARPDPLKLGLDVTDDYRLLNHKGVPAATLFALGPPIRGSLWETTAVPDIRKQCEAVARHLAGRHLADFAA